MSDGSFETLTPAKVKEILETYDWIKVNSYKSDKSLPAEEQLAAFKKHHHEEVDFLIDYVRELVKSISSGQVVALATPSYLQMLANRDADQGSGGETSKS